MADHFGSYLSDTHWQIFETGWDPELQNVNETRLALGNGYIGSRSILEENPPDCRPGTFFAGLFEGTRAFVPELINAPNPFDLRVSAEGEKLDVLAMDVVSHKRVLDMFKGLLTRHTVYANARKKRIDYQSMRFISMHDKNTAVMQVCITPLDDEATFTVTSAIDSSVVNRGLVTEGDKQHVAVVESSKTGSIKCVCTKTIEKEVLISYRSQLVLKKGKRVRNMPDWTFELKLKKGETACITNYLAFNTSFVNDSIEKTKKASLNAINRSVKKGFDQMVREHSRAWARKWKKANIEIDGAPNMERVIRFNMYHLFIAASEHRADVSIGAKALTGEGYRGHVFWDTELFCLPFFIYTNPAVARNQLIYRYNRLDAARKIAVEKGYKGAMFPWESADTGEETTPAWYKDGRGKIQRVLTMEQECHITADIAYAVVHYYSATNDVDFLLDHGLELILETARFWASRAVYNKRTKKYDIKNVIGPDEFHEGVNNNAFTNMMAQWNLKIAAQLLRVMKKKHPAEIKALTGKIRLKSSELDAWRKTAANMHISFLKKTKIIEQFQGYLKRRKLPLPELDQHSMPGYPDNVKDINSTQYVKQADVVMLMFVLSDFFSLATKKKNYHFYEKRTLHKSSLSASVHALIGAEVGDENKALHYLDVAAHADLEDVYGNTQDGIHAASLGGVWQALINGFAGMRIRRGILSFSPRLPSGWKKIKFSFKFKGYDISAEVGHEKVSLTFSSKRKTDKLPVRVYRSLHMLQANKKSSFHKKLKKKAVYDTRGLY